MIPHKLDLNGLAFIICRSKLTAMKISLRIQKGNHKKMVLNILKTVNTINNLS